MEDRDILPDNFKPVHYSLSVKDLDLTNWTFGGVVAIDCKIVKPTKQIVINTLFLKLTNAKVTFDQTKSSQTFESTTFSYDDVAQRCTIDFDQEFPVTDKACITIEYTGEINNDMAGFYRSKYLPAVPAVASTPRDAEYHYMLSTQFEACDARRAFPCFDEPNLKATFDFEIEVPTDLVALSNMPVKSTTPSKEGWHVVAFDRTPVMSTYILAWALGDFTYIEAFTDRLYNGKRLPVRVYTTRGLEEQGRWALEHAPKTIDYFSEIFDIDYPLPKSDLLCAHEFTHGAMENWGLVTYRTTRILYDEKTSSPRLKNDIAYVVAHELAHQWFGNLVTMDWWDELWLNEGFATWVGWIAVDHFHPDWNVWVQYILEGMEQAFTLDGLRNSHPIHVPVRDALDVNQVFDYISYHKGCSSIRMLANHLGVETFLKGVSNYLKAHAYGNAKTKALWDAISEASGQNVNALMEPWISKIGHPVLKVEEEGEKLALQQSRFLSSGDVKPEEDNTTWWLPLRLEGKTDQPGVATISINERQSNVDGVSLEFYKVNSGASGFYRLNYPESRLDKLSKQLDKLSFEEKVYTISSASALAFSGHSSPAALLTFLQGFEDEEHPLVLERILVSIDTLKSVFGNDAAIEASLAKFTNKLLAKQIARLGWASVPNEHYQTTIVRGLILRSAVADNAPGARDEAVKRFNAWVENPVANAIEPSLRSAVWLAGIIENPAHAVATLKKEWYESRSVDTKQEVLESLGRVQDLEVIKSSILTFLFNTTPPTDAVASADVHIMSVIMGDNTAVRDQLWDHVKNNWDIVNTKLGNPIVMDRFVGRTFQYFVDAAKVDEIAAFFSDKDTKAYNRSLNTVLDHIAARAAYRQRGSAALQEWLTGNGY